jgi:hypothetical protein
MGYPIPMHLPRAPRPSRLLLTALALLLPMLDAVAQQRRPGARPPVQREALPPPPAPLHRRVMLAEIGQPAGIVFDTTPQFLRFPLPPGLGTAGLRMAFQVELIAPFAGRHAVEVAVNGRPVGALPFAAGQTRLGFEALVPPADILRDPAGLGVALRLVDPGGTGARATLLPTSHLTLPVPPTAPTLATLAALLPPRMLLLAPPNAPSTGFDATTAGEALRIGLALAARGHAVRFVAGPPDEALIQNRVWEAGAVLFGAPEAGVQIRMMGEVPVVAIGPGGAETVLAALLPPPPPAAAANGIAFGSLAGDQAPQDAAEARWGLGFDVTDLPPGMAASALEAGVLVPPGSAARMDLALNGRVLGSAAATADGRLRVLAEIPYGLIRPQNRIEVGVQREGGPPGPAQLLPDSALRLMPAPPPRDFLDLVPHVAGGMEVLLDTPDGAAAPATLDAALWVLRGLARPGAPLRVRLQAAGALAPALPFLAFGAQAPPGSAAMLRLEGRSVVLPRGDGTAQPIGLLEAGYLAQRVAAAGQPGIWLLPVGQPPPLPAAAPGLGDGDTALLDQRGVALALRLTPLPVAPPPAPPPPAVPQAAPAPAEAAPRSLVQVWRPWVAGAIWLLGFAVILHAFSAPRREWEP